MSKRLPNLNQLRAFEAAARLGSFKAAAEELFVTQAAISHQIKALEAFYGRQLFQRLPREVRITDDARTLASGLSSAFEAIASASGSFVAQEMSGVLRISVTPFYANRMILPYLDGFRSLHPKIEVEFDFSYDVVNFSDSGMDAALRYGLPDRQSRVMHFDRVSPIASPLLVGDAASMTPAEIAMLPLAAVKGQEDYWTQWFAAAGVSPPTLQITSHAQRALAFDYALAGNAVVLADLPLIRTELANGSVQLLSDVEITLDRGIYLVEPAGQFSDARVTAFGDWLSDRVQGDVA